MSNCEGINKRFYLFRCFRTKPSDKVYDKNGNIIFQSDGDYGFGKGFSSTGTDLKIPGEKGRSGGIAGSPSDPNHTTRQPQHDAPIKK